MANPNANCLLLFFGLFALIAECLSPGRIIPGVVGAAAACAGLYGLSTYGIHGVSKGLLAGLSITLGIVTLFLGTVALEARRNKRRL